MVLRTFGPSELQAVLCAYTRDSVLESSSTGWYRRYHLKPQHSVSLCFKTTAQSTSTELTTTHRRAKQSEVVSSVCSHSPKVRDPSQHALKFFSAHSSSTALTLVNLNIIYYNFSETVTA